MSDPIVDEMNEKHAVINIQGKIGIMNFVYDPILKREDITLSPEASFKLWYKNKFHNYLFNKNKNRILVIDYHKWKHRRLQITNFLYKYIYVETTELHHFFTILILITSKNSRPSPNRFGWGTARPATMKP